MVRARLDLATGRTPGASSVPAAPRTSRRWSGFGRWRRGRRPACAARHPTRRGGRAWRGHPPAAGPHPRLPAGGRRQVTAPSGAHHSVFRRRQGTRRPHPADGNGRRTAVGDGPEVRGTALHSCWWRLGDGWRSMNSTGRGSPPWPRPRPTRSRRTRRSSRIEPPSNVRPLRNWDGISQRTHVRRRADEKAPARGGGFSVTLT